MPDENLSDDFTSTLSLAKMIIVAAFIAALKWDMIQAISQFISWQ